MVYDWYAFPPERLLVERFGMQNFHPGQREIIERLVQGKQTRRVLAIQHTGWGKSLCYQMASMYLHGLTIVISPLKALMRDQCMRCNDIYGISAAIVSSDLSGPANREILEKAVAGEFEVLYIAPERFNNRAWQEYSPQMQIGMVVVDEAHCISVWGHDFRPEYRRIRKLLALLPENVPVLALTATANRRVEHDVLQQIGADALVVRGSMQRPNLHVNVVQTKNDQEKLSYLAANLSTWPGSGIIYTATKPDAVKVAMFLQQRGIEAEYYHAERGNSVRQDIERGLMANEYKVICSTNALGMGIDKPDLRFVIHYHFPASPIHYYQEIGRAGRDSEVARCTLLYNPADLSIQQHFIQRDKPTSSVYGRVLSSIRNNPQGISERDLLRATGFSEHNVRNILVDLEEHGLTKRIHIEYGNYVYVSERAGNIDLSIYDEVHKEKEKELADMQSYAQISSCHMGYLTEYLGDPPGYHCGTCGNCQPVDFEPFRAMQEAAKQFLEQIFLLPIEKRDSIEAGYALEYYSNSETGKLVRASKYEGAGSFAEELVLRAVEVVRAHYTQIFDGIVSVPSTNSGNLVEVFARSVAEHLAISYISGLVKTRLTQEQKALSNRVQKQENVQNAFTVRVPSRMDGKTLLLIDDIYDSGYTLREVAATLHNAGAKAVYPLTITRTRRSDDQ